MRHFPLLNAAIDPGIDNLTGNTLVTNVNGAFGNIRYDSDSKWPTKAGSAETFLRQFDVHDQGLRVRFCREPLPAARRPYGQRQRYWVGSMRAAISSTTAVKFKMTLTPVPEIEAIYPIISLCAAIAFTRILRRRRSRSIESGRGRRALIF